MMIHFHSWMEMEHNNMVDVSSFLLFETTGDSESIAVDSSIFGGGNVVAMDEDDAQSCSWDSSDVPSADELNYDVEDDHGGSVDQEYYSNGGGGGGGEAEEAEDEEEEEDDEEYSSVCDHGRWSGGENVEMPLMGQQLKSSVSVDSTQEFKLLNEVEKSKLFWETCLAS